MNCSFFRGYLAVAARIGCLLFSALSPGLEGAFANTAIAPPSKPVPDYNEGCNNHLGMQVCNVRSEHCSSHAAQACGRSY